MKGSIYDPYYAKMQDLIFQGMPLREVYEYMKIYFNMYASYQAFMYYIKTRKLDWYIPVDIEAAKRAAGEK